MDPNLNVFVASWDSTTINSQPKILCPVFSHNAPINIPLDVNIPKSKNVLLSIIYEGIEKQDEGSFSIDGKIVPFGVNKRLCKPDTLVHEINSDEILKTKSITFQYNISCKDSLEGYLVKDVRILY